MTSDELIERLPHGSGINGDWNFYMANENTIVVFENVFDAMTESGMYCHYVQFQIRVPVMDGIIWYADWEAKYDFDEDGCDCLFGLKDYLNDLFGEFFATMKG